ncbi:MAG: metallopeptidase family protein [bacterium]
MEQKEFEKLVAQAVRGLPDMFRKKLENIVVIVNDSPAQAQEKKFGKGVLGLYEGIPLADRGQAYSGAMPDKITIFKNNIEAVCSSENEIMREVKHVVMHEIAHHFGDR